jgi:hypothetical protein
MSIACFLLCVEAREEQREMKKVRVMKVCGELLVGKWRKKKNGGGRRGVTKSNRVSMIKVHYIPV